MANDVSLILLPTSVCINLLSRVVPCVGWESSVTRFGEISPLWHNFKNLWDIFEGLFCAWENVDPGVAKMFYSWASFNCCGWSNTLKQFIHLVTLVENKLNIDRKKPLKVTIQFCHHVMSRFHITTSFVLIIFAKPCQIYCIFKFLFNFTSQWMTIGSIMLNKSCLDPIITTKVQTQTRMAQVAAYHSAELSAIPLGYPCTPTRSDITISHSPVLSPGTDKGINYSKFKQASR